MDVVVKTHKVKLFVILSVMIFRIGRSMFNDLGLNNVSSLYTCFLIGKLQFAD